MKEETYAQVVAAVEAAQKAPESEEARNGVVAACEAWFQDSFGVFGVFTFDTFEAANAVARRWRRMPIEKWPHFGKYGQHWVAVRRIYWLMYRLLCRLCFGPESTNPHFWYYLRREIDDCHRAMRVVDHPQEPVSDALAEFLARKFEEDHPQAPEPGEVPEWLANFVERTLGKWEEGDA